jgi:hypothetical protein
VSEASLSDGRVAAAAAGGDVAARCEAMRRHASPPRHAPPLDAADRRARCQSAGAVDSHTQTARDDPSREGVGAQRWERSDGGRGRRERNERAMVGAGRQRAGRRGNKRNGREEWERRALAPRGLVFGKGET